MKLERNDDRTIGPSAGERQRVADEFGAVEGLHQTLARLEEHLNTKGLL